MIVSTAANFPVLSGPITISTLTINVGAMMTLAGSSMTAEFYERREPGVEWK